MSSRPLFISVAESMVILPPIAHVGCLSASSTVTSSRSPRPRPRNGPPLAVRISLSTVPGRSPASSWYSAECSESTGIRAAPVASASAVTSSPPTTRDSLLASARSMPSPSVATVGPSPAEPTSALSTSSAPDSTTSSTSPCAPTSTSPSVHASAARAPASASASAIRRTPKRRACSTSGSQECSALRPTSSRSRDRSTMSSAWVPIEPVEPRTRRRRGTAPTLGAVPCHFLTPQERQSAARRLLEGLVARQRLGEHGQAHAAQPPEPPLRGLRVADLERRPRRPALAHERAARDDDRPLPGPGELQPPRGAVVEREHDADAAGDRAPHARPLAEAQRPAQPPPVDGDLEAQPVRARVALAGHAACRDRALEDEARPVAVGAGVVAHRLAARDLERVGRQHVPVGRLAGDRVALVDDREPLLAPRLGAVELDRAVVRRRRREVDDLQDVVPGPGAVEGDRFV